MRLPKKDIYTMYTPPVKNRHCLDGSVDNILMSKNTIGAFTLDCNSSGDVESCTYICNIKNDKSKQIGDLVIHEGNLLSKRYARINELVPADGYFLETNFISKNRNIKLDMNIIKTLFKLLHNENLEINQKIKTVFIYKLALNDKNVLKEFLTKLKNYLQNKNIDRIIILNDDFNKHGKIYQELGFTYITGKSAVNSPVKSSFMLLRLSNVKDKLVETHIFDTKRNKWIPNEYNLKKLSDGKYRNPIPIR